MSIDVLPLAHQRVILVDNFEPSRSFVRFLIAGSLRLDVVGEASDGLEAVRKIVEIQPDVVITDIAIPTLNGFEIAKRVRNSTAGTKVLFLSLDFSPDMVREAIRVGAHGFVDKHRTVTDLRAAIQAVLRGEQFISTERPEA
jgi:DNA-binding NarL/FixJ family response regulator